MFCSSRNSNKIHEIMDKNEYVKIREGEREGKKKRCITIKKIMER